MKKPTCTHALLAAVPLCATLVIAAQQPANAQYFNPSNNNMYGTIQQDLNSGLITPGQANSLMNQQNSLMQRAARLLRNDGGVLTPNDSNKLAKQAARDQANLLNDVNSNTGNGIAGTGFGGLLGNLFGTNSNVSYYNNGLYSNGLYNNGINPYGNTYNTGYPYNAASPYGAVSPYLNGSAPNYNNGLFGYSNGAYPSSNYGNGNGYGYGRYHRHNCGHW